MSYTATGKLIRKMNTEQITDKFKKREFVIEVEDGQYSTNNKFELHQDKVNIINGFNQNQIIEVFFNIRGKEHNGRYFNNLVAWKVEPVSEGSNTDFPTAENEPYPETDDLPF